MTKREVQEIKEAFQFLMTCRHKPGDPNCSSNPPSPAARFPGNDVGFKDAINYANKKT